MAFIVFPKARIVFAGLGFLFLNLPSYALQPILSPFICTVIFGFFYIQVLARLIFIGLNKVQKGYKGNFGWIWLKKAIHFLC